ncbi:GNAT family N-acetyltransferase [Rossellomorea sp. YZS02]|uniref:GNAT family N-acetyltransferase n=1 Tax=Rossellomorea sp. YZS02 TaxID=3097358 RepID=UPI002A0CD403|nr:GNAT family N-acetyltransferase [Rossellomorea sp. YZS02]MDX8345649.1 GNAT family N-acetyltransferase [Rossellomorea sp. YZS02]
MIQLRPMTETEYGDWRKDSIKEYAEEKTKAGNFKEESALSQAEEEFNTLLPDGLQTINHHLFTLYHEENQDKVGTLWVHVKEEQKEIFIYDIKVLESKRGLGYGKAALLALDSFAREMGLSKISLHVFGHNKIARSLYQNSGYEVTNVLMSKLL